MAVANDGATVLPDVADDLFMPAWRNEGIGRLLENNGCIEVTPLHAQFTNLVVADQVQSMNANHILHPGRAQNLIEFNWLMNGLPAMGMDQMMLVYGTAYLINQPV